MNQTTAAQAQAFIAANPGLCYRTLEAKLLEAHPDLTWQDARYIDALAAARPDCGYDCDEQCPVTGNAEE